MKKIENVLNGFLGCGKNRPLSTFPQIFFLFSLILSKKFTMKGGEGSILDKGLYRACFELQV